MTIGLHKATDNTDLLGYLPDVGNVHLAHSEVGGKIKQSLIKGLLQGRDVPKWNIYEYNLKVMGIVSNIFHKFLHPEMYNGINLSTYILSEEENTFLYKLSNIDISDCLKDLLDAEESMIEPYIIKSDGITRLNIGMIQQRQKLSSDDVNLLKEAYEQYEAPYNNLPEDTEEKRKMKERLIDVYNSLKTHADQQKMKKNISMSGDGKLLIIPENRKYSLLKAVHDGKNVISGSHHDKNYHHTQGADKDYYAKNYPQYFIQGLSKYTYLSGPSAQAVSQQEGKNLFQTIEECYNFFQFYFPGKDLKMQMINFVKIMGLEKMGYYDTYLNEWQYVSKQIGVVLTEQNDKGEVVELWSNGNKISLRTLGGEYASPCLTSEPV